MQSCKYYNTKSILLSHFRSHKVDKRTYTQQYIYINRNNLLYIIEYIWQYVKYGLGTFYLIGYSKMFNKTQLIFILLIVEYSKDSLELTNSNVNTLINTYIHS